MKKPRSCVDSLESQTVSFLCLITHYVKLFWKFMLFVTKGPQPKEVRVILMVAQLCILVAEETTVTFGETMSHPLLLKVLYIPGWHFATKFTPTNLTLKHVRYTIMINT